MFVVNAEIKVSVVMACFNSEATIERSIRSFLEQGLPEKELIVIDGASGDRTADIVRSFDSPLIRLQSEPDRGIYDAINKGIAMARGESIGLLHSNDLFSSPDILTRIAGHMEDPALDGVFADIVFFRQDRPQRIVRRYSSASFSPARIASGWMPAHTSLYLRRSVFQRFGTYKIDYKIAADFEYVARIFSAGISYKYVPEVWVLMLAGGASTAGLRAKIILNAEVVRACRENGIDTSYARILSKYPKKALELVFPGR
jgi:glycosyltransferase involved in cell wall biosynthesis